MQLALLSLFTAVFQIAAGGSASGTIVGTVGNQQLTPPASTTPEKDRCVVSGRVTNMQTGEPLKKANLHLTLHNSGRATNGAWQSTGYSGVSAADGSFKFEGVEPGDYSLRGERSGFIQTAYGSKTGVSGGTTLQLQRGQQLTELKMQLVPQATISGRVMDEDGDPVGGASVQALGRTWMQGGKARYFPSGQATSDDTGAYRISNLRPGKYYVSVQNQRNQMMGMVEKPATPGKPDIEPVRTFYPSSLDRTGASTVQVTPGQEMPGVDVRMRSVETFHIRGKLAAELSENEGQPNILMLVPVRDDNDMGSMFGRGITMVEKDGTFDIAHVAPGSYAVTNAMFNNKKGAVRQNVEVGSSDVNGVVLTVQPNFTIHGSVELQGTLSGTAKDKALENIQVMLMPDDFSRNFSTSQAITKGDGSFTLENLTPSKVRANVWNEPDGSYVKSIRFGNQEVLGRTIDLSQVVGGDIHVVLRAGAAEVSGTVQTKQEDPSGGNSSTLVPASSASILLIPEDLTLNGGSLHTATTNQNGAFTEKGLPPGRYYALAYEADEYRSFDDPAILKQLVDKGAKVEVKENDKQQVQLTLLPEKDLEAALTAAGVDN